MTDLVGSLSSVVQTLDIYLRTLIVSLYIVSIVEKDLPKDIPYLDKKLLATDQYLIVLIVWFSLFAHVIDGAQLKKKTCYIIDYVSTYQANTGSILEINSRHKKV